MENLTRQDLLIIKTSVKFVMEDLTNDLKKSIKTNDYDEIDNDIQVLTDYFLNL